MTLVATTTLAPRCGCSAGENLNVSFYEYVRDRILKKNNIPPLSDLITKAALELMLVTSYSLARP